MDDDGELECSTRSDVKTSEAEIEGLEAQGTFPLSGATTHLISDF